ncbi:hypothetical protein ACKUG4_10790 [Pseudomonas glycinae]|uniref:hypothetical protein n=1 Tax=Pseudomonas TaxID=286 RepID=UPI000A7A227C|nr:hypothetical protein [Pseudomonas sp. DR 5-09]
MPITDLTHPIRLFVGPELITQPGGGPLVVRYEIRDTVNNWSLYSLSAQTDLEDADNAFLAPQVLDALGDEDLAEKRGRIYLTPPNPENSRFHSTGSAGFVISIQANVLVEVCLRLCPQSHATLRLCLRIRQNPPACAPWGRVLLFAGR